MAEHEPHCWQLPTSSLPRRCAVYVKYEVTLASKCLFVLATIPHLFISLCIPFHPNHPISDLQICRYLLYRISGVLAFFHSFICDTIHHPIGAVQRLSSRAFYTPCLVHLSIYIIYILNTSPSFLYILHLDCIVTSVPPLLSFGLFWSGVLVLSGEWIVTRRRNLG
jgi:hypothetical protein